MLQNVLSYAVFPPPLQHLQIMVYILYIQGPYPYMFQGFHKLVFLLFQVLQEPYPVILLPCNKHNRLLPLLYSKALQGLHKELRYLEVSKELLSMQGNRHPHQQL